MLRSMLEAPNEAIHLFMRMEEAGMTPNEVTVVAVLAACADLGVLDLGWPEGGFMSTRTEVGLEEMFVFLTL